MHTRPMTPQTATKYLRTAGLTEAAIASAAGVAQSTINRIANGRTVPGYEAGKRLVDMATAHMAAKERK